MQLEQVRVNFCLNIMIKIIKGNHFIDYNEHHPSMLRTARKKIETCEFDKEKLNESKESKLQIKEKYKLNYFFWNWAGVLEHK